MTSLLGFEIKTEYLIVFCFFVYLIIDCIISGIAISFCLIRKSVENNLDVVDKEKTIEVYHKIYNDPQLSNFIYQYWNDEKMIKTYPNLKLTLANGEQIYVKDLTPDIKPYYYKFKNRSIKKIKNEVINTES